MSQQNMRMDQNHNQKSNFPPSLVNNFKKNSFLVLCLLISWAKFTNQNENSKSDCTAKLIGERILLLFFMVIIKLVNDCQEKMCNLSTNTKDLRAIGLLIRLRFKFFFLQICKT